MSEREWAMPTFEEFWERHQFSEDHWINPLHAKNVAFRAWELGRVERERELREALPLGIDLAAIKARHARVLTEPDGYRWQVYDSTDPDGNTLIMRDVPALLAEVERLQDVLYQIAHYFPADGNAREALAVTAHLAARTLESPEGEGEAE